MTDPLQTLPFYFRELSGTGKYVLSNQAGSLQVLHSSNELESLVNNRIPELDEGLREDLLAKSFISESGDAEIRLNAIASSYAMSLQKNLDGPSLFMVVPTLRCDHDCRYCQVSRAPVTKPGYDLDEDHISKILAFISGSSTTDHVKIEFQGGEPLLAFPFVKTFVRQAKEQLAGKKLSFVICSALGPLDEDIIGWAAQNEDVLFSVSLDGPEALHVTHRPSKYFHSHRHLMKGLARLVSGVGIDRVSCLATVTSQSLDCPEDIVRAYFNLGLSSLFLRPLSPFGFASQQMSTMGYKAVDYFEFYKKCLRYIIELNRDRIFAEDFALAHLHNLFRPAQSGYIDLQQPAGYVLGALVINYDGNVFGSDEARMLYESTQAEELVLGNIESAETIAFHHPATVNMLSGTFLSASPGCDECAWQPFCGADPLYHLSTQGDHVGNKSISFFCQLERYVFDHLLELHETDEEANEVFLSWLNH